MIIFQGTLLLPLGANPVFGNFGVVVKSVGVGVGVIVTGVDEGAGVGKTTMAAMSSLVIVQVALSPAASVTLPLELQAPLKLRV